MATPEPMETWSDAVEREEAAAEEAAIEACLAAAEVVAHPEARLVEDFFAAPRAPANTHEEWLLRLCATLMEREARAVSVAEAAARAAGGADRAPRRRRRGWKPPSGHASDASTPPNTATG